MLKVGLTGSIAVGKSHVCGVLEKLGCHVLDADRVAREVVEPGSEGLKSIVEHFGTDVLEADGRLDRSRLGSIVFSDPAKLQLLNSLLHPLVISRTGQVDTPDREAGSRRDRGRRRCADDRIRRLSAL